MQTNIKADNGYLKDVTLADVCANPENPVRKQAA